VSVVVSTAQFLLAFGLALERGEAVVCDRVDVRALPIDAAVAREGAPVARPDVPLG
jgi:hypothetical protein